MKTGFGVGEGAGAIEGGLALWEVSWETGGIVGAEGMRAAAFGVVGVEG